MTRPWQLDGPGARAYERHLVPALFAPFAERLLERASLGPGERVLDVACGTGIVARLAASRLGGAGRTTAFDTNPRMLDVARSADTTTPPIEWLAADAAEIPLADASFDLVACQQGLQYFADPAAALLEMRRVLGPDGRLAVSVWRDGDHNPAFELLARALDRHAGPEVGTIMRTPFSGPDADELRALIRATGLRDVTVVSALAAVRFPSPRDFLLRQAAASPLAGPLAALTEDEHVVLAAGVAEALRPYTDDDGVGFPMSTHIATARR